MSTQNGNNSGLKSKEVELRHARAQFIFWRFLLLIQIASILGLVLFVKKYEKSQRVFINVPQKPLAGYYHISDIPDDDLLSFGEEFINLVATYQRKVAEKQFLYAFDMSSGKFKEEFKNKYILRDAKEIVNSNRSQIFYADYEPKLTRPLGADYVIVSATGELEKYAGSKPFFTRASYKVTLQTVPHSTMNEYGISVVDFETNVDNGY